MLIQIACLAATLLAPQGTDAPRTDAAVPAADPLAAALPSSTLAYLHVGDLETHLPMLRQTALARVLAAAPIPDDARAKWTALVTQACAATGLDEAQLAAAFSHGVTLALTGLDADGTPHLVLGARLLGDPAVYARALEQAARGAGSTAKEHGGTTTWTLQLDASTQLAVCVSAGTLLAASSEADLRDVIDRQRAPTGAALSDQPEYRELTASAGSTALVSCFVQTAALGNEMLRRMTGPRLDQARRVLKALDTQRITAVGYGLQITEGRFADHLRVFFPAPRTGLLGALCGASTPLGSDCARLVPADVAAFTVGQIDLKGIFEEALALVGNVDPNAAAMIDGGLRGLASNVGVDVEQDVLQSLGQRFATLQWPSGGGHLEAALVFETRDSWRLEKAVSRLLGMAGLRPKSRTWRGHSVYALELPALQSNEVQVAPGYAFTDTHFVLASSEQSLRNTLMQLDEPTQNSKAEALLSHLPAGAIATSWMTLGSTLDAVMKHLDATGNTAASAALREVLADIDGDIQTTVARDNGGVSIRTTSAIGNPILVGAISIGAAVALPALVRARASATATPRSTASIEPSAELRALLRRLGEAQEAHRGTSPDGAFATLDELAASGRVASDDLGKSIGNGVFRHGEYLLTALLPDTAPDRQSYFALLAWPAEERRGSVLATTPTDPMLINRAIAASAGIRMVELSDLFLSGRFGTALVPGWREVQEVTKQAPVVKAHDQVLMDAILSAESKRPSPLPKEVLEGLASENPKVAARAAWAVGSLGSLESVPKLCETVESYPDVDVRRQAMAALGRLADQRSIRASMHALASDDALLRALAAANLGRVRAGESTNELLSVVGRETGGDDNDRLAALLALADIGSSDTLLPASAAVDATRGKVADGLAFAFQTITPKMEPEQEAKVLMAVLDHPSMVLRRYAIQRLGQLKNPSTRPALEGRLGAENDPSLRPLVEAALLVLRGTPPAGTEPAASPLDSLAALWRQLTPEQRSMAGAGAGSLVVLVIGIVVFRARRRRAQKAAQWAAFTAPSDDYERRPSGLFENEASPDYNAVDDVPGLADEYAEETEEVETPSRRY